MSIYSLFHHSSQRSYKVAFSLRPHPDLTLFCLTLVADCGPFSKCLDLHNFRNTTQFLLALLWLPLHAEPTPPTPSAAFVLLLKSFFAVHAIYVRPPVRWSGTVTYLSAAPTYASGDLRADPQSTRGFHILYNYVFCWRPGVTTKKSLEMHIRADRASEN